MLHPAIIIVTAGVFPRYALTLTAVWWKARHLAKAQISIATLLQGEQHLLIKQEAEGLSQLREFIYVYYEVLREGMDWGELREVEVRFNSCKDLTQDNFPGL